MKTMISVVSISLMTIGCGAGAMSSARMSDRNVHHGTILLDGEHDAAMLEAEGLMERHCGTGYTVDGVSASGEVEYHCTTQRDIDAELPPALAKAGR